MLKKLLLFILIFFIIYILAIFKLPTLAGAIEKVLGINGFNEFVLKFKGIYDETFTKIPTKDEFKNAYETVSSGAVEFGENFKLGAGYTKEKIDNLRETMSGVETSYGEIKESYTKTKEYIEANSGVIQDVRDTIDALSGVTEKLTNSGTIESIQKTIDGVSEIAETFVGTGSTSIGETLTGSTSTGTTN